MRKDQRVKTDKTKDQYEEEKYGGECTFAPNIISKDKQGNETWTYDRISRDAESSSGSGLGFGALFGWVFAGGRSSASSSISNRSLTVIITFDDNKNVIDYAYQSLEF